MQNKPMSTSYQGKYIWIIGASSGIGAALARELATQGATLALSARRGDKLNALIAQLDGSGHTALPLDVRDHDALKDAAQKIPKLDSALFMAAYSPVHDKKIKDINVIHDMTAINLGGAFNMIDIVQPIFEKQGQGQIVLCASVAGYRGLPHGQPYCAHKAALISLAESLHVELAPKNIDVKVINPGFVRTPLTDKNDFSMPMMISAEKAAKEIAKGLRSKAFEIHFPKRFTFLMKIMRALPAFLYFMFAKKLNKKL